jgi:MFS family permease
VQGGLIGRLTKKRGEWPLAIAGAVFVAVGMAFYVGAAWRPTLLVIGVAGAVNAIGRSLQGPTLSSLISKYSDPREQGVVFGLYHGLSSLARVIGPILAGLTYPLWNHAGIGQFVTAGAIVLVAAVWTGVVRAGARGRETNGAVTREEATGRAAATEIE